MRIFDNDNFLIRKNIRIAISRSACKKKRVIGVELAELTISDIHTEHHTLTESFVHVGAHECQAVFTAHRSRALKGNIYVILFAEVHFYTFGAEHILGNPLLLQHFAHSLAVKDSRKVDIYEYVAELV